MRQSTKMAIFALLVVLAAMLAYWPGLTGPLLFDDKPALTGNALVQIDGTVFDEWRTAALSSNSGPLRRPVAMLSFAANHALTNNFSPFGLKVVNLAIHIGIGVLLYFFFLAVLQALQPGQDKQTCRLLALTGAAIWLLHPLNVSTVLYAVQRMAQWASMWGLVGLLVFMRYRQRWARLGAPPGEIIAATLWLVLISLLAVLSKENGLLLPWLVIVLEVCIFRGAWAGQPNRYLRWAGWILLIFPLVLVVVLLALVPETFTAGYAWREFTLEQRLMTQGRLLWRYLGWLVLPNIQDMGFQHDDIPTSTGMLAPYTTVLALIAWASLLALAFALRRRYPLLLLAVLFFLVGHSLESSVIALEMVYEHRNYLPGALVCLAIASALLSPAWRTKKVNQWYPLAGVLSILCLLLVIRVQSWSDELTLSRTNLVQHPESSRSNYFYANALLRNFRRGEQLGLTEREKGESLLLARHYFERMYQANKRDVAALVMLYYLDSYYFTELQEQIDWLSLLEVLLDSRALQPSDWNALSVLFEILASETQVADEARVLALLDMLGERYNNEAPQVLRFRYNYLSAKSPGHPDLIPLLREAQTLSPQSVWVYQALLTESFRSEDVAGMYDYTRLWLSHDTLRGNINQMKSLFTFDEPVTGGASD